MRSDHRCGRTEQSPLGLFKTGEQVGSHLPVQALRRRRRVLIADDLEIADSFLERFERGFRPIVDSRPVGLQSRNGEAAGLGSRTARQSSYRCRPSSLGTGHTSLRGGATSFYRGPHIAARCFARLSPSDPAERPAQQLPELVDRFLLSRLLCLEGWIHRPRRTLVHRMRRQQFRVLAELRHVQFHLPPGPAAGLQDAVEFLLRGHTFRQGARRRPDWLARLEALADQPLEVPPCQIAALEEVRHGLDGFDQAESSRAAGKVKSRLRRRLQRDILVCQRFVDAYLSAIDEPCSLAQATAGRSAEQSGNRATDETAADSCRNRDTRPDNVGEIGRQPGAVAIDQCPSLLRLVQIFELARLRPEADIGAEFLLEPFDCVGSGLIGGEPEIGAHTGRHAYSRQDAGLHGACFRPGRFDRAIAAADPHGRCWLAR